MLDVETVTYVDVRKGKLGCVFRNFMKFVSHSPSQTLNTYLRKAQNEQKLFGVLSVKEPTKSSEK